MSACITSLLTTDPSAQSLNPEIGTLMPNLLGTAVSFLNTEPYKLVSQILNDVLFTNLFLMLRGGLKEEIALKNIQDAAQFLLKDIWDQALEEIE